MRRRRGEGRRGKRRRGGGKGSRGGREEEEEEERKLCFFPPEWTQVGEGLKTGRKLGEQMCKQVYQLARTAVSKHYQLGSLNNRSVLPHSSGG